MEMASPVNVAANSQAKVEALGDLKLYRVPMRVTVAAQAQKQVALLVQPAATFERVYILDLSGGGSPSRAPQAAPFELRGNNVSKEGLGVPLPAGMVALFARGAGRNLYAGEAPIDDLTIGERVVLRFGDSPDVTWTLTRSSQAKSQEQWRLDIDNARDTSVSAEVTLPFGIDEKPLNATRGERGWVVPVEIMPNGTASIAYMIKQ